MIMMMVTIMDVVGVDSNDDDDDDDDDHHHLFSFHHMGLHDILII